LIAVDTNLLVYAHREDAPSHRSAYACLEQLATGRTPWAIPWPCIHEFLGVVTHPHIYKPATPLRNALDQVAAWIEAPNLVLLAESADHWTHLKDTIERSRIAGPQIHDARIAALCSANGIDELWTADRDFSRFPRLKAKNPLVA